MTTRTNMLDINEKICVLAPLVSTISVRVRPPAAGMPLNNELNRLPTPYANRSLVKIKF